MSKLRKTISITAIVSEGSHVFCCVLPTLVSILSLMAGVGLISALPPGLMRVHDTLHHYELPMIVFSAGVLMIGWGLYRYSLKIDCHDTGCCHEPCAPKKRNVCKILLFATVLFVVNVTVYSLVHVPMEKHLHADDTSQDF